MTDFFTLRLMTREAYSRVLGNGMRERRAEGVAAVDEWDEKGRSAT
jgi:hypothetical protein